MPKGWKNNQDHLFRHYFPIKVISVVNLWQYLNLITLEQNVIRVYGSSKAKFCFVLSTAWINGYHLMTVLDSHSPSEKAQDSVY